MPKTAAVEMRTDKGPIRGRLYPAENARGGVVLVGGAERAEMYEELAFYLQAAGMVALRPDYRRPDDLAECAYDVLAAVAALYEQGTERVVLLGWSFGSAVVTVAYPASNALVGLADTVVGAATIVSRRGGAGANGKRDAPTRIRTADTAPDLPIRLVGRQELVLYPGAEGHVVAMFEELYGWSKQLLLVDDGAPAGGREHRERDGATTPPTPKALTAESRALCDATRRRLDRAMGRSAGGVWRRATRGGPRACARSSSSLSPATAASGTPGAPGHISTTRRATSG